MKTSLLFSVLFGWVLAMSAHATGWELVWSDEFNGAGMPDPTKWGYESGYVRNQESQYYMTARKENSRVENGMLILEARKEHYTIPAGSENSHGKEFADYSAASLNTAGKFEMLYGRVEMRARLPHGKGVWPAFWMLGANIPQVGWPACGEIDIMELVGKEPDVVHGTAHWKGHGRHESQGNQTHVARTDADFHVYAVEWTADKIDFLVDDRVYNSVPVAKAGPGADNAFHKPHYLLLNFALGGDWGGEIDDGVLPQKYLVDYVRVYREKK